MRPVLTEKEKLRVKIEQQTQEYLSRNNEIEVVPSGKGLYSGMKGKDIPAHRFILQSEPYYHPLLTWQQMGRGM